MLVLLDVSTALIGLVLFAPKTLRCQEAVRVTACDLKRTPAEFNHKLVEVTGFISHGFEDFGLFDPSCPEWPYVWLEYGGTKKSGTMYCCGVSADRSRPKELVVENIPIPLVVDEKFESFDQLIQNPPDTVIHARLVGRFFSGKQIQSHAGNRWGGYGHMGCCSLFVIQSVTSVAPHDRKDLDYRASPDQPNIDKTGCGYKDLVSLSPYSDWLEAQRVADRGERAWVFDEPNRVAADALSHLGKVDEKTLEKMTQKRRFPGRLIYELKANQGKVVYMIVVSRPYMLSFYARDPQKIAWVVAAAYESSCDQKLLDN